MNNDRFKNEDRKHLRTSGMHSGEVRWKLQWLYTCTSIITDGTVDGKAAGHAMKTYGGVEVTPSVANFVGRWQLVIRSLHWQIYCQGKNRQYPLRAPEPAWTCCRREIFCCCRESNPRSSRPQHSYCINWGIWAQFRLEISLPVC